METIFLIVLFLSNLNPQETSQPPAEPDPLEIVWTSVYPTLALPDRNADRKDVFVLPPDRIQLDPPTLYATNRTVWTNFLGSAAVPPEEGEAGMTREEEQARQQARLQRMRQGLARRLTAGAKHALRADAPPDRLDPAARELATAYMDLADLGIVAEPPPAHRVASPLLRAFFSLYSDNAGPGEWQVFYEEAQEAAFGDALHLVARVPPRNLGQAHTLANIIGSSGAYEETEQRRQARSFIELRLRLAQP